MFTVAADQAAVADLEVSVTVAQTGDFVSAAELGTRTVTIDKDEKSAKLTVATVGDLVDERDSGAVIVTVQPDPHKSRLLLGLPEPDYSVGSPASASVAVADDAAAVTIAAGPDVVEGEDAVFAVTAARAPAEDLTAKLTVAQTGAVVRSGDLGDKTVTIAKNTTSAQLLVPTVQDGTAGTAASVTVTLDSVAGGGDKAGGYEAANPKTATVRVADNGLDVTIAAVARTVIAGDAAEFTLTAAKAPSENLTVTLTATATGGAADPGDLGARTATIAKGTTTATLAVDTAADIAKAGTVTATITAVGGEKFAVGDPRTATVDVADGVDVTVTTPNKSILFQYNAEFDVTADTAVPADLKVTVNVSNAWGRILGKGQQGDRVVTIPKGKTTHRITFGTRKAYNGGAIKLTVKAGSSYKVAAPDSATVTVGKFAYTSVLGCRGFEWRGGLYEPLEGTYVRCNGGSNLSKDSSYELELVAASLGQIDWAPQATPGTSCNTPGVDYIHDPTLGAPRTGTGRDYFASETWSDGYRSYPGNGWAIKICNDNLHEASHEVASLRLTVWVDGKKQQQTTEFVIRDKQSLLPG